MSTKGRIMKSIGLIWHLGLQAALGMGLAAGPALAAEDSAPPMAAQTFTLDQCLRFALENNHRRPASAQSLAIAEAQHRQALAGYWPQLSMQVGFEHMEKEPNFLFPSSSFAVPGQAIPVGPGVTIPIPAQTLQIPAQDVKLMDRDTTSASLDATWLLWDGGMRRGLDRQAAGGVDVARSEVRRTGLEIQDSVTRMYYGAILARQLHQVGSDTLARMEATLTLTETMYKEGSGRVKKTDYLDNRIMVETIRATVALLEKNDQMAQAALANTMGLGWQASVSPADADIPFEPIAANLDDLVNDAFRWNLDWEKLEAGLRAQEGGETAAESGHYPKLAMTVDLQQRWNGYDAGLATDQNKTGWTVGIGVKIPLFSGQLVSSQVREAHARVQQTRENQFLLKEGIGLMVKDTLLSLNAAAKSLQATGEAMKDAAENRDLNTRAYQNELVDTQDVIKSQLIESLMTAHHLKDRYDHIALQSQLTLIIGNEVWKQLKIGN
jgi:outer membrane protein TolC